MLRFSHTYADTCCLSRFVHTTFIYKDGICNTERGCFPAQPASHLGFIKFHASPPEILLGRCTIFNKPDWGGMQNECKRVSLCHEPHRITSASCHETTRTLLLLHTSSFPALTAWRKNSRYKQTTETQNYCLAPVLAATLPHSNKNRKFLNSLCHMYPFNCFLAFCILGPHSVLQMNPLNMCSAVFCFEQYTKNAS